MNDQRPSSEENEPEQERAYTPPEAEDVETSAEPSEAVAGPASSQVLGVEESARWH